MPMEWEDPVQGATEFVKPSQLAGRLLIVAPIGYIEGIATKFGVSDAISCDVVDLDAMGDDGVQGKLYRSVNFMQGRLIQSLRPKIGKFVLGRIGQEPSKSGMNPAWVLVTASGDPEAVARANAWEEAHPNFKPTEFVVREPRPRDQQPQQFQAPLYPGQPGQFQPNYQQAPQPEYVYQQRQAPPPPPPQYQQPQRPQPQYQQQPQQPQQQPQYQQQPPPPQQAPVPPQYMPPPQNGQVGVAESSVLDRLRRQQDAGVQRLQHAADERQQYGY